MRPSSVVNTDGFSGLTTTYQLVDSITLPGPIKSRSPLYWKNCSFNGFHALLEINSGSPTKLFVQIHAFSNGSAVILDELELTLIPDLGGESLAVAVTPLTIVPAGRALFCDADGKVHVYMKLDAGTANVTTFAVDFGTPNPTL